MSCSEEKEGGLVFMIVTPLNMDSGYMKERAAIFQQRRASSMVYSTTAKQYPKRVVANTHDG
jgi:hypothetical protein